MVNGELLIVNRFIKQLMINRSQFTIICGAEGIRTPDLLNAIQALSQLSYSPKLGVTLFYF
jgi:hypothetical protein